MSFCSLETPCVPFPLFKVDLFPLNFPSSLLPTPNFSALTLTLPNIFVLQRYQFMFSLPFKLSWCQLPYYKLWTRIRCFNQAWNAWGAILWPCTYYFVSFCTPFPSPFSLAFYTQYACMLTCNTQPLQKDVSVRGGYVIYINISPKNDIPV